MILIGGLCEAYHWTLDEAMRLTMPQIIMLNHAAWVNRERSERRWKAKREREQSESKKWNGKSVDELNSDEFSKYWSQK